ncbi:MAG: winged helix-turn-helix transcriptional regulator [Candidatus Hodarchaeales archaeon]|jgi:DNA-binding Lrp family transcriptional regulator
MDLLDNSLLLEMEENCRVAFSKLAQKYNISKEEVGTRITNLVNKRFIVKFTVVPSSSLYGYQKAILCFRSRQVLDQDRITLLGINPNVEFISIGPPLSEGFALIYYRTEKEIKDIVYYFNQFHSDFEEIRTIQIEEVFDTLTREPKKDLLAFQKVDWLILSHLREQGRLSFAELSRRTDIDIRTIGERLEFLRMNNLIDETIHINPGNQPKKFWVVFRIELSLFTRPLFEELKRELWAQFGFSFWKSWKILAQPAILLSFFCANFQEFEKVQTGLADIPGMKSIEYFFGGSTYYFSDFRDEVLEEKRSHGWFSPEQWVSK